MAMVTVMHSVIIPTRNRAARLRQLLDALVRQAHNASGVEIVVVDSMSTDDTRDVVTSYTRQYEFIRGCVAAEVGGSAARNAGIKTSLGRVLSFLDDDVLPSPRWLRATTGAFENPTVACVAGRVKINWTAPRPPWLPDKFLYFLGEKDYGETSRELEWGEYPGAANVAFRREDIVRLRGFPTHLGHHGDAIGANEEVYLCKELRRQGGKVYYVREAEVTHFPPPHYVTREYFLGRARVQGAANAQLDMMFGRTFRWLRLGKSVLLHPVDHLASRVFHALDRPALAFKHRCDLEKSRGYLSSFYRGFQAAGANPGPLNH
jgi:glycosyltransferase involved in cell wall biosynthesis